MPFDRDKFLRVAAVLGSPREGERHNAADLTYAMLKRAGKVWAEVLKPDPVMLDTVKQLKAELDVAHTRIDELERASPGWQPITRFDVGKPNRTAPWLLGLHQNTVVHFTPKELGLLNSVSKCIGPPTPGQKPWFEDIVNRTCSRYGLVPPP